jgi:hypothetical protein
VRKRQGTGIRERGLRVGCWGVLAAAAVMGGAVQAQQIQLGQMQSGLGTAPHKEHVELLSDAVQVMAGSPQVVELRFRVDDGYHINSHTPKDELLLPTVLKLRGADGVTVLGETYQKGLPFELHVAGSDDPKGELMDVYQGEFRVMVRVTVPKGASTMSGELHYQACVNDACFPPKTLPVMVAVRGE